MAEIIYQRVGSSLEEVLSVGADGDGVNISRLEGLIADTANIAQDANQKAENATIKAEAAATKAQTAQNGLAEKLDLAGGQMTGALNLANVAQTESGAAAIPASWSLNRHPIKISGTKMFFVGGANASDTADLYAGRGESAAMPFATLDACLAFVCANYMAPLHSVKIVLQADCTLGASILNRNIYMLNIIADSPANNRKLTLTADISVLSGNVCFTQLKIDMASYLLQAYTHPGSISGIMLELCEVTGSAMWISANGPGSSVRVKSGNSFNGASNATWGLAQACGGGQLLWTDSATGTVTGKRYSSINGGTIYTNGKGPNYIPGTIAGTCDEGSKYW